MSEIIPKSPIAVLFAIISILTGLLLFNNLLYSLEIPVIVLIPLAVFWMGSGILVLIRVMFTK